MSSGLKEDAGDWGESSLNISALTRFGLCWLIWVFDFFCSRTIGMWIRSFSRGSVWLNNDQLDQLARDFILIQRSFFNSFWWVYYWVYFHYDEFTFQSCESVSVCCSANPSSPVCVCVWAMRWVCHCLRGELSTPHILLHIHPLLNTLLVECITALLPLSLSLSVSLRVDIHFGFSLPHPDCTPQMSHYSLYRAQLLTRATYSESGAIWDTPWHSDSLFRSLSTDAVS